MVDGRDERGLRGNVNGLFCVCTFYVDPFLIVRIELSYAGAGELN